MSVLLLAGPPAAGHNTIAEALCLLRPRVALVDGDDVRAMLRAPQTAPWGSEEGERQYRLGIRNTCALARGFDADGCDVVIVDVAAPETLPLYRSELHSVQDFRTVLLLADPDILIARDIARDPDPHPDPAALTSWHACIRILHGQLAAESGRYDRVLDSDRASAAEIAVTLARMLAHRSD